MINLSYNGKSFNQREEDGYVNLGELCATHAGKNKQLSNWTRTKGAQEYLSVLTETLAQSDPHFLGSPIIEDTDASGGRAGAWGHPLVAIEVARWISPAFGVWCNQHIKVLIETGTASIQPTTALPKSFSEALYLAAQLQEQKELLEAEVVVLESENQRLAEEVDEIYGWSSIIRVAKHNNLEESQFKWHRLKAASEKCGDEIKKAPCPRFGHKNLYSHNAWRLAYPGVRLPEATIALSKVSNQ